MKKAFTLTFRISELNGIQNITLKSFLIGVMFLSFSLLSEKSLAQISRTVFNDFNNNGTKDATTSLTEAIIKVITPLNSGPLAGYNLIQLLTKPMGQWIWPIVMLLL